MLKIKDKQCCQNDPCSHGSVKMTKKLYYARQASSWQYHLVKKHYAPAHIPVDWTCKIHAHDYTVLSN